MGYRLDKDQLEQMIYELQNTLSVERVAAELIVSRALIRELRRGGYVRPRVRLLLERIPRPADVDAWEKLKPEEAADAGDGAIQLELEPGSDG